MSEYQNTLRGHGAADSAIYRQIAVRRRGSAQPSTQRLLDH